MSRNVLVFGASGEIGGRIARLAVDAGHTVYGVSRGANQREMVGAGGVNVIHGDKYDETFLRDLGARLKIDAVIDSVPALESVELYMKHFPKVENVFFCSSTGTFVPLQSFPADERHPWRDETPVNFYNQSLRDRHALEMCALKDFPITILRPTNIIGEGRIPLDLWGGRNIEFFRLLQDSRPLAITPCENILVQSGYNHDLANAFVQALDHPDKVRGEIFIISCKRAITLGRYLEVAMEFLGSHSEIRHLPPEELVKAHEGVTMRYGLEFLLEHMCFDIGKAEKAFGYKPTKTTEEGLIAALEWCKKSALL